MLSKFVQENKESWDSFLDTCTFAYNTFRHESTLHTPFEVMFGRQAVLPIDLDMEKLSPERLLQEYEDTSADQPGKEIAAITTLRQALLQQVKNNIAKAQMKQKEQYDKKHTNPPRYQVGVKILKKDFTRKKRKGGKMDPKWLGPYTITQELGKGFYKLESCNNPDDVILRVNGAHLKIYHLKIYHTPPPSPGLKAYLEQTKLYSPMANG